MPVGILNIHSLSKHFEECFHEFHITSCSSFLPRDIKINLEAWTNFSGYRMKPDPLREGKKWDPVLDEGTEENVWN